MDSSVHLKLAIVIPAYNASQTIERVFERIPSAVQPQIVNYIVVNDGSTDDTAAVLTRLQQSYPNVIVLHHDVNQGYGAAEKTLLHCAVETEADVVVLLHADGQYAPEKLPKLLEPFTAEAADIVQGSRMMEGRAALRGGMPRYKYVANRGLTAIENMAFGLRWRNITAATCFTLDAPCKRFHLRNLATPFALTKKCSSWPK
ncbi:MAG: hypothetical protein ETSY1_09340 [Candidatus Entotheonella factor]|uniref:Glycosyltransferase 2-like domain-containing protein n=1 Tax=Entotheonella factor TaxID=1429438 RepID=W4LU54_ENTF1|nr:MAG: hypothetical protein ETSY1_09340 [Candidatus Entotheonella factor]